MVLLVLFALGCDTRPVADPNAPLPSHVPSVELFVMSQCPFGVRAEQELWPVKRALGEALTVELGFIGHGEVGSLTSLHGAAEVAGDVVQACAAEQNPTLLLPFLECQNTDFHAVDSNWRSCGVAVGLDVSALGSCIDSGHGEALVAASFSEAAERGAKASPTVFIDGEPYLGGRSYERFMQALCPRYGGEAPAACATVEVPLPVPVTVITDARCETCSTDKIERKLHSELAGLQLTELDYTDAAGREAYEALVDKAPRHTKLPVGIIEAAVEQTAAFAGMEKFLTPLGDGRYALALGGRFDPTAEICDNQTDDDADGLLDCADDGCADSLVCREEVPQRIDLFVMSRCPYGARAMVAADEVARHFGSELDLQVHFIGDEEDGVLTSMHGQEEVDDDIREVCAQALYPDDHQFMRYLSCFSEDYQTADWQQCARDSDMEVERIEACFSDGQGQQLLEASFETTRALGFRASPTWLLNNRHRVKLRDAAAVQQALCELNPELAACGVAPRASGETVLDGSSSN